MNFFLAIFFLICAVTSASILHPTERQAGCARCKLGTKCVGSGIDARCVLPKSIGGLCGMNSYSICSSGLLCENGRCVQYMSAGGPCKTPQQICKSGLVCNSIKTCSPPLTIALLGESCKNPLVSKCETGLRCRAGICTQPGLQGQPCNNPGVICESKTSCVGPTGSKSCKIISGVGQTCADASMYDCDKNACDGSICTKIISKGSSCWKAGLVCETGTTCLGSPGFQTCKSVSNVGETCFPMSQFNCADTLKCDGKICTRSVPIGDSCEGPGLVCDPGSTCFGRIGSKACKIVSGLGEICPDLGKYACSPGLSCNGIMCTKTVLKGAKCETKGLECERDSFCEGSLGSKTCKTTLTVARTCRDTSKFICAENLKCNGGICTQTVLDGEPCEAPGLVCNPGSSCHGPIGSKACKIVSDLGGECPDLGKFACSKDLSCDGSICTKSVLKGGKCGEPGLLCERGSFCHGLPGRQFCKSTQTVGLTCSDSSKFTCADTLVCNGRICTLSIPDGNACQGPGLVCRSGSKCRGPAGGKTCKAIGKVGDACSDPTMIQCRAGLQCDGTVCTATVPIGASCEGKGYACPSGAMCTGIVGSRKCKRM